MLKITNISLSLYLLNHSSNLHEIHRELILGLDKPPHAKKHEAGSGNILKMSNLRLPLYLLNHSSNLHVTHRVSKLGLDKPPHAKKT